jgi:hypothetical protein
VGVALAGGVTGVGLGVEEDAGKGVGESTRTVLVGKREDVGITSVQATSTKPTNNTPSLDGFIDRQSSPTPMRAEKASKTIATLS